MKKQLSLRTMETLLNKAGAKRSSDKAKKELRDSVEKYAKNVSSKIIEFSKHAKRKTIKHQDVVLATRN